VRPSPHSLLRALLGAAALLALPACTSGGAGGGASGPVDPPREAVAATELSAAVVLPVESRRMPVVRVYIPGAGLASMLLDTGAERTLVDTEAARRLGLELLDYRVPLAVTRGGKRVGSIDRWTRIERLELSRATASDLSPPVTDLRHLYRGLDGIVGQDVLSSWGVAFDGGRSEIRLLPPEDVPELVAAHERAGTTLTRLPLTWWRGVPVVELEMSDGTLVEMVVDTGASTTALPADLLREQGLRPRGTLPRAHVAGWEQAPIYRVEGMRLGGRELSGWVLSFDGERGYLGYDLLSRMVSVIDAPGDALWVGPARERGERRGRRGR
jgi:hypothetical protein